ncbi:hypothetical protein FGG12_24070 [Cupriavidus campinensis]|uniref:Uncharacterized protein n=1 Tax=Cupriavidus campinensis TaxID=151783 RepID=A0ABY3EGT8_9BURK|nr:hypothetical protein FGG12_24070 [Cupriavidus campinensis]
MLASLARSSSKRGRAGTIATAESWHTPSQ